MTFALKETAVAKLTVLALLMLRHLPVCSQQAEGVIEDSLSGEKIAYATIYLKHDPAKGSYSGLDGRFSILCRSTDTVCIRAIGYRLKAVPYPQLIAGRTLRLAREDKPLPEVVVTAGKCKSNCRLSLGFHRNKKQVPHPGTLGAKILVFIDPVQQKDYRISKLFFSIAKPAPFHIDDGIHPAIGRQQFTKGMVRILLYSADTVSTPEKYESLLPVEIVTEVALRSYLLKIDVSRFNIPFPPDGVYLGLEWLGEIGSNQHDNIAPEFFESRVKKGKQLNSFYYGDYFDPYQRYPLDTTNRLVPNFGLELIRR